MVCKHAPDEAIHGPVPTVPAAPIEEHDDRKRAADARRSVDVKLLAWVFAVSDSICHQP
jgi:hypothetical protein